MVWDVLDEQLCLAGGAAIHGRRGQSTSVWAARGSSGSPKQAAQQVPSSVCASARLELSDSRPVSSSVMPKLHTHGWPGGSSSKGCVGRWPARFVCITLASDPAEGRSMQATASTAAIAPVRAVATRPCTALLAPTERRASDRTAHLRTCGPPTSTSQAVSARRRGISGSPHVAPEASRTWKRASSSGPKHSCRQWRHTRAQVAILLGIGGWGAKDGGPAESSTHNGGGHNGEERQEERRRRGASVASTRHPRTSPSRPILPARG